jgi:hypothetical protein
MAEVAGSNPAEPTGFCGLLRGKRVLRNFQVLVCAQLEDACDAGGLGYATMPQYLHPAKLPML